MSKWKMINRDGFHWLAVEVNGVMYTLHRMAPLGHCFRPGQIWQGN